MTIIDTQVENRELALFAGTIPGEEVKAPGLFSKDYMTIAGFDTKLIINGEVMPEFQAISFKETVDGITGDLYYVILGDDLIKEKFLFMSNGTIVLACIDEDGNCSQLTLGEVKFTEWSFGISTDDIVAGGKFLFTAKRILPWKKLQPKV